MKKLYLFFTLLLTMLGATTMRAQDEVTIPVNMTYGKWIQWNSNESNPWARTWNSTTEPKISICCKQGGNSTTDIRGNSFSGANNMSVWGDARTDLMFFTNYGTYEIMVEEGWYIASVEFDFDCANNKNEADGIITLTLGDSEPATSADIEDFQHVAWENNDDEVYSVQFTVNRDEGTYNFARTRNFFVVVKKQGEAKAAMQALQQVLNTYQDYQFLAGPEPGNYGEAEVAAFYATIDAAYDAEGDSSLDNLPDAELAATYRAFAKAIVDAYEAVLASRNTVYDIPDGYYRIKTGLQYRAEVVIDQDEDGNDITETQNVDKYMLSALESETIYGRWGSVENLDADCSSLWKITKKEDGYDFQNMGTDARFNNVARSSNVTMKQTSENLMVLEPVGTVDGVTYANIRVSTQDGTTGLFLHQGGHGGGTGAGSYLVGWYTSAAFNSDGEWQAGGSEWSFVPVDAETAEAIIKAYEPEKDQILMKERYKIMLADAKDKVKAAKDITYKGEALITSVEQLSSPYTETSEGSIEALLDGNTTTYWHSDWSGGSATEAGIHYLQAEITKDDVASVLTVFTRRPVANGHVTELGVFGTNDAEAEKDACEELATLTTPYTTNTETLFTTPFDTKGYKYLRYYANANSGGSYFMHMSEFQIYDAKVLTDPTTQFNAMGDAGKNLEDVLAAQADLNVNELTAEQYDALKTAYDAFIAKYVDPTELRDALNEVGGIAEGIVVGTQPGYWKDANVGATLAKTVDEAKAYDAAGVYNQETSDKYAADLKAQADAVYAAAIQIEEGKWYRIRFASEEDFDAHEWDKTAGYVEPAEGEPEINAPLFGKYVSVANYVEVDEDTGMYDLEMFEGDEATYIGENLHFLADENITKKDMSLFRFIAVGDSAYLIQNKATGLFLKAAGTTGYVRLNVQPSVFNTKAVGYGLNVIASRNLIGGTNENYLHGQKNYNILVTWNASTPGTASAMYIEEAGDVEADFTNTANLGVRYGAVNAYCYPFEITEIADGQAWGVAGVEGNKIQLCKINGAITAGRPFIYINGETEDFEAEAEAEPVAFTFNTSAIATEPQNGDALKGTYSTVKIDRGDVYCKDNALVVNTVGKDDIMVTYTYVSANSAYIMGETPLDPNAELEVIWDEAAPDGIQTALQNVAKTGIIYTLDGRVAGKGNLNNVKGLGRGIYILNGTKVVVK